jgi:TonB-dependent starch-binding outer membrane protein SusC
MKKRLTTAKKCFLFRNTAVILLLLLLFSVNKSIAQEVTRTISGKIIDENQKPIQGVTIVIDGEKGGNVTNKKGEFTFKAPNKEVKLILSFVGYVTKELVISKETLLINESLEPTQKKLDDVVVIAFGSKSRGNLTESVSTVKSADISKSPVSGIDQALQGRAAGVNVISGDATPGGRTSIQIRGLGTINNADPLFVIDGIIYKDPTGQALSNINPSDIESVSILKDASATSIYGFQASNGVVVVTTKKGKEGKPKVSFNTYTGTQKAWKKIRGLTEKQYAIYNNEFIDQGNLATGLSILKNPDWANPETLGEGTDWVSEVFRNAKVYDAALDISGGAKGLTYNVGLGYRAQDGIVIQSGFKRYTLNSNVNYQANSKLKVGVFSSFSYSNQQVINTNNIGSSSLLINAISFTPSLPNAKDSLGRWVGLPPSSQQGQPGFAWFRGFPFHPVAVANSTDNFNINTNLFASAYAQYNIIPSLSFKSSFGIYRWTGDGKYYQSRLITSNGVGTNTANILSIGTNNGYGYNWDNYFAYDKRFGKHSVSATLGTQYNYDFGQGYAVGQNDFLTDNPSTRILGLGRKPVNFGYSYASDQAAVGFYSRVNYGYDDRYLVTLTGRRDGTSVFKNNKYGSFGAVSVAWRAINENFLKQNNIFSDLKVRLSYGINGNKNALGAYTGNLLVGSGNSNYILNGNDIALGVSPISQGNGNLSWEKGQQMDIGLDLGFLKDRLTVTLDYYNRVTKGLLIRKQTQAIYGTEAIPDNFFTNSFTSPTINAGRVENKGFEISVGYKAKPGKINYNVNLNASYNENKFVEIDADTKQLPITSRTGLGDINRYVAGEPLGVFFGHVIDGIFQNQKEIDAANAYARTKTGNASALFQDKAGIGDIRYKDINEDGVINDDDRKIIGNPNPKLNFGFSGNVSYKNFDFNFLLQGVGNVDIYNGVSQVIDAGSNKGQTPSSKTLENFNKHWTGEGTNNRWPRYVYGDPNNNKRPSDLFIEKGGYLRARVIQLGYTLPKKVYQKLFINGVRVYVSAQNLFTITKYKGSDPEILKPYGTDGSNNQSRNTDIGVDLGAYPQPKTFLIGINVNL